MKNTKKVLSGSLFLLAAVFSAHAIITGDNTTAESDPSGTTGLNWDYVYNYKNSSSVAVDPYWILTAAHVADDGGDGALTIDSTAYTQQEIVYHDTADLALVRYDKALPGSYALFTGTFSTSAEMLMVGFGNTGTVYTDSWDDSGSGKGTKRWGTQQFDMTASETYDVGGTTGSTTSDGFWMDFVLSDTSYEAGVGTGDSGGGTFVNDGGTWKLAGINTSRDPSSPPIKTGAYDSSFAVETGAYETWINETVPEPASAVLLIGVAALLGVGHRIRCMME